MNKINEAFEGIKAEEELKKSTMEFIAQQRSHRLNPQKNIVKYSLAAAAVIIFTLALGTYEMWFVPVTVVSIDVNPSLELRVNRLDRVLDAKAFNDDGTEILDSLSVTGKNYEQAIDTVLNGSQFSEYLNSDSLLTFTVASENDEEIISRINRCLKNAGKQGVCVAASSDAVNEAHSLGLSLGKYQAYLEISQYDNTITPEDCRNMTMKELNDLKKELSQSENDTASSGNGYQHGGKHNYGKNKN